MWIENPRSAYYKNNLYISFDWNGHRCLMVGVNIELSSDPMPSKIDIVNPEDVYAAKDKDDLKEYLGINKSKNINNRSGWDKQEIAIPLEIINE